MAEPGWYPDPLGGEGARYWDGTEWEGAIHPGTPIRPATVHEFPEHPDESRASVAGVGRTGCSHGDCCRFRGVRVDPPHRETPKAAPPPRHPRYCGARSDSLAGRAGCRGGESLDAAELDSDPDLKKLHLTVVDVVLVNKSGNEFKGIATVKTSDGVKHDVPVEVTSTRTTRCGKPARRIRLRHTHSGSSSSCESGVENFTVCPSGLSGVSSADTSCAFADSVRLSW